MKKQILFILVLFTATVLFGQETKNYTVGDTIFFKNRIPVTNKNYDSYSIFIKTVEVNNKTLYKMMEYELNKDKKHFYKSSIYHAIHPNLKGSEYLEIYFHENGIKSAEGYVSNGSKYGKWKFWYDNGNQKSVKLYHKHESLSKNRKESEMISYWDRNGNKTIIDGNGTYIFKNDSILKKGFYRKNKKHGKFVSLLNGKKKYEEYYKKGKLIKGTSWDDKGKEYSYKSTFVNPYYPRGNKGIRKHVIKNFKVPDYAFANKISGRIVVGFKIEKSGEISNIKILKKLCDPCDQEAIRVIKLLKKWKPGKIRGQNVRVGYSLPITYNIE
ncbi:TonB family protein [Tenacibaculum sp. 190524A05c]|uniref:TonB family protein n=1 Tax=Tenacibaculum platacis TaxID=3137852 RepID=UPI0032B2E744